MSDQIRATAEHFPALTFLLGLAIGVFWRTILRLVIGVIAVTCLIGILAKIGR